MRRDSPVLRRLKRDPMDLNLAYKKVEQEIAQSQTVERGQYLCIFLCIRSGRQPQLSCQ